MHHFCPHWPVFAFPETLIQAEKEIDIDLYLLLGEISKKVEPGSAGVSYPKWYDIKGDVWDCQKICVRFRLLSMFFFLWAPLKELSTFFGLETLHKIHSVQVYYCKRISKSSDVGLIVLLCIIEKKWQCWLLNKKMQCYSWKMWKKENRNAVSLHT